MWMICGKSILTGKVAIRGDICVFVVAGFAVVVVVVSVLVRVVVGVLVGVVVAGCCVSATGCNRAVHTSISPRDGRVCVRPMHAVPNQQKQDVDD